MKTELSPKIFVGQSVQPSTCGFVVYTHVVQETTTFRDRDEDYVKTVCGLVGNTSEWKVIRKRSDNFDNNEIVYCYRCKAVVGDWHSMKDKWISNDHD